MSDSVTFLFWNLDKKDLRLQLQYLLPAHGVDVLVLAECEISDADLTQALAGFTLPTTFVAGKIKIVTRLSASSITPVFDDPAERLTIRRVNLPGHEEILLAAIHFQSKVHWTAADQLAEAGNLVRDIEGAERVRGHKRTVLVGDLNMDPFDDGVIAANGLHGVMTKALARATSRVVAGREYSFFYNPMWAFFGDGTPGPAGTHFYHKTAHISRFWHIFDQVLLRPALMDDLVEVTILDEAGAGARLLTQDGKIDQKVGSDHLPLLFRLRLT